MKTSKIEKHMHRRTVIFGDGAHMAHGASTAGVIAECDRSDIPAHIEGVRVDRAQTELDHNWYRAECVRKATDDERSQFFAWLVADGRDIADGFARFGGMPRGFEAWRAAQTPAAEPAPACAVGWMFTKPNTDVPEPVAPPFTIGQRVRIACSTSAYAGRVGEIVATRGEPTQYGVALRGDLPSWCVADWLEPVADEPTPEPVVTPQHKVGDLRVRLTYDGFGEVGRIAEVDQDGDVYLNGAYRPKGDVFEPTPGGVARLVEQQRERGIVPELGDLVFISTEVVSTAIVAHNTPSAPVPLRLLGAMCGGGAISWALTPDIAAHTLVIRRNPLREVADE